MSDANPGKVPDADPIILFVTGNYKEFNLLRSYRRDAKRRTS